MIGEQQTNAALIREIQHYVRNGYRVIQQTGTSAQLMKPKKFSFFWAFIWFLAAGIGILVYIFYYMSKHDEIVYLQATGDRVSVTRGK